MCHREGEDPQISKALFSLASLAVQLLFLGSMMTTARLVAGTCLAQTLAPYLVESPDTASLSARTQVGAMNINLRNEF